MRNLKLFIACSLDGFIAREGGSVDWLFTGDYGYRRFYSSIDTILMGRKTYELSLSFGETHKGGKVYVFTKQKKLKKLENVEFVPEPINFTKKLRHSKGKGIWLVGGGEIASVLLNNGLVDEMMIFVHPIVLGSGVPLFKDIKKDVKLKLVKTVSYKNGLVQLYYNVLK